MNECIGVVGAGYVGLVSGACFSALGFTVGIVEVDAKKIEVLRKGKSTIYEPGLTGLIEESLEQDRLHFYGNAKDLFKKENCDIVFIAVGTPDNPDGSCNLDYVRQAVRDVVAATEKDLVIVIKSTVPVGTSRSLKEFIVGLSPKFRIGIVNNPEFLREGTAVGDFMKPERVVLGGTDGWALDKVKTLYETLLHNGHPLFVTDHESAELGKLASNLMLASRVSLVNQISRLASAASADIKQVEKIMRSDSRIGSKYLYSGLGYGGSCFPKDVKSFIYQCQQWKVDASVAQAVEAFNNSQKLLFVDEIAKRFPQPTETTISLLGLAFKPETDDIRESPALDLTRELSRRGYKVRAYDPKALENYSRWAKEEGLTQVTACKTVQEALSGSSALILVTEWQELQRLASPRLKTLFSGKVVFDGKNVLNPAQIRAMGYEYVGVGRK